MMRALYSGVAGLKTHMQRMDVIGNNIANVNTYGFKSSRATFRDMYYQQVRGASVGTMTRGGVNPSSVGYGSQLSSIDLMMGSSSFTSTGNQLDIAITGEGFLQVQDPEGNIYYTKAGMLDIDTLGRVVDTNGNFVLGTSATSGQLNSNDPSRSIIQITVDPIEPQVSTIETTVLGKGLTITASNQTNLGNVSFTFSASATKGNGDDFVAGEPLEVVMESGNPNIAVRLNQNYKFSNMAELSTAINNAITEANGGAHPAGSFTFTLDPDFKDLTGSEIATSKDNSVRGKINTEKLEDGTVPKDSDWANYITLSYGSAFSGAGDTSITWTASGTAPNKNLSVTVTTKDGKTYTNTNITDGSQAFELKNAAATDPEDRIIIKVPGFATLTADAPATPPKAPTPPIGTAIPSTPSTVLGLGKQTWTLDGGTEGGPQSYENLTGISIGSDGTIIGSHPVHGRLVLGRIDLANFANPMGLEQTGNSYFQETANSGAPSLAIAGEDGTGAIRNSALEMSNVDLAQEFSDMIITQRGYQANSRIITVSDTMLEELVNLKR